MDDMKSSAPAMVDQKEIELENSPDLFKKIDTHIDAFPPIKKSKSNFAAFMDQMDSEFEYTINKPIVVGDHKSFAD